MTEPLQRVVAASSVCEIFWPDSAGWPRATGAVALWWEGSPAIAFTYASAQRARSIARAHRVCLTLTERRSTGRAFTPTAVHGRPRLYEDLDGDVFTDSLVEQELRRYPPSRAYADSLLLRRENWWYLPRLIVSLEVDATQPIAPRTRPEHHVLAVNGDSLRTITVRVEAQPEAMTATVEPISDDGLADGPAVALGQDASFPDLEQWSTWSYQGRVENGGLLLRQPAPVPGLGGVPTLWRRLRFRREFARACRTGIAAARRSGG